MELFEKTLGQEEIFSGRIFSVELRDIELPDGHKSQREIVHHNGGAAILALTDDGRVPLVRQFRSAIESVLIELPAGCVEADEEPLLCAKRELKEECGLVAERWQLLTSTYSSPGFLTEKISVFLARDLKDLGVRNLDEGEFLEVDYYSLKDIRLMLEQGTISDAKTVLAFYKLFDLMNEGGLRDQTQGQ